MKLHPGRKNWSRSSLLELQQKTSHHSSEGNKIFLTQLTTNKKDYFHLDSEDSIWIVSPENTLKIAWDLLAILFIIGDAVIIPIIVSFSEDYTCGFRAAEEYTTLFFFLDVIITLNTGYYERGHLVRTRLRIFNQYLKLYLIPDVISLLPLQLMMKTRLYLYIVLLKLYRVIKLFNYFDIVEILLHSPRAMIISYYFRKLLSIILLLHWLACLWVAVCLYILTHLDSSWIVQDNIQSISDIYMICIYFVATTASTIGYGDYYPVGTLEYLLSFIVLVVGVMIFSFNITSLINIVIDIRKKKIDYQDKIISLNIYMRAKKLPGHLKFKLRRYLEYTYRINDESKIPENQMLTLLSDPLREEMFSYTAYGKMILGCGILLETYESKIIRKLSKFMQNKVYGANDMIIQEGDQTTQLYFIKYGRVEVIHTGTETVFAELKPGNYFGEIGFFTKKPRTASIRCVEIVEVFFLNRQHLDVLLYKFPVAVSKTTQLEIKCANNNFSALGVKCYLCKVKGHIASQCMNVTLSTSSMHVPDHWMERKRSSKVINPRTYNYPNVYRKTKSNKLVFPRGFEEIPDYLGSPSPEYDILAKKISSHQLESIEEEGPIINPSTKRAEEGLNKVLSSEEDGDSSLRINNERRASYRLSIIQAFDSNDSGEELDITDLT